MTGLGVLNTIANRIPEKPVMALLDALNAVRLVLERRLLFYRSDLLQSSVVLTTDSSGRVALPDLFLGVLGNPFVGEIRLQPLNIIGDPALFTGIIPSWYSLTGNVLQVFPVAAPVAVTVPLLLGLGDIGDLVTELPLSSLFHEMYVEGALVLLNGSWPTTDPRFQQLLNDYVDVVVMGRNRIISSASRVPQYF